MPDGGRTSAFGVELPEDDWAEAIPYAGQHAITLEPEPIELTVVGVAPDDQLEIVKWADIVDVPREIDTRDDLHAAIDDGVLEVFIVDAEDIAPMPEDWFEGRRPDPYPDK